MNINNLISKAALCSAALAASSLLPSCVSPKEVLYIQDVSGQTNEKIKGNYQTVIQKDDQLSITVSSKQPELAAPFAVSEIGSSSQGTSSRKGYLVDANGSSCRSSERSRRPARPAPGWGMKLPPPCGTGTTSATPPSTSRSPTSSSPSWVKWPPRAPTTWTASA